MAFRKVTTEPPIIQSQTESAFAQMIGHGFVAQAACLWVLLTGSLADFQSPKVDGMMLRA